MNLFEANFIHRKTKTFVEERIYERQAGAAPDEWKLLKVNEPLDDTINQWSLNNQLTLVSVSAPGIDSRWLDKEMTKKSVLIAITVIYEGGVNGQWPERK
jgi:hypothetical protein